MDSKTPIITGFINWLHTLTAQSSKRVSQFVESDARLRSPESEGVGGDAIAAIYAELFDDAQSVTIRVLGQMEGHDGHTVYLRWDRLVVASTGAKQALSGITEITIGLKGKIISLIEYWDSMPEVRPKRGYFAKLFGR